MAKMFHSRLSLWDWVARSPEGEGTGTATPAAPAVPAAPATPAADFQGFADVLRQPADTPPAQQGEGGGDGQGAGAAGSGSPPASAEGGPPPSAQPPGQAAPAPATPAGDQDRLQNLREQVQRFLGTAPAAPVAPAVQAPAPAPAQPQGPAQPQSQPQARPAYDLDIPHAMVEALRSEDANQFRQGLKALSDGIANRLHKDFTQAMVALYQDLTTKLPQVAVERSTEAAQISRIKEDFYGNFPQVAAMVRAFPSMEQGIWGQIQNVASQMQLREWTPEFRNGVGALIHLNLGIPLPAGAGAGAGGPAHPPAQPPAPAGRPAAAGHFSTGSGGGGGSSRPNGTGNGLNDFLEVLNAGSG